MILLFPLAENNCFKNGRLKKLILKKTAAPRYLLNWFKFF